MKGAIVPIEFRPSYDHMDCTSQIQGPLAYFPRESFSIVPPANRSSDPSLPVPVDKSTNQVTSGTPCTTHRGSTVLLDSGATSRVVGYSRLLQGPRKINIRPGCTEGWRWTGSSVRQHILMNNNLEDERGDNKQRSKNSIANNSKSDSDETEPVSGVHKFNESQSSQHYSASSDPDSDVAKCGSVEEAKTPRVWYLGTGAAQHATGDLGLLFDLKPVDEGRCVYVADGGELPIVSCGTLNTPTMLIPEVCYVPGLMMNIVSVGQLAELGYSIGFGRRGCVVTSASGEVVGKAHASEDGMYEVEFLKVPPPSSVSSSSAR